MRRLVTCAGAILCAASACPPSVWVATDGNDANPGTEQSPYRTVERGWADVVAGSASVIEVRAGDYALSQTLELLSGGGTSACPVGIHAADPPPARTVISGGVALPPSTWGPPPPGAPPGAVAIDLAAAGVTVVGTTGCVQGLNGNAVFHPDRAVSAGVELFSTGPSESALVLSRYPAATSPMQPIGEIFTTIPGVRADGAVLLPPDVTARLPSWAAQLAAPEPGFSSHGLWTYQWADATFPVSFDVAGAAMVLNTTACGGGGRACDSCCYPSPGGQFAVLNVLAELHNHVPGTAWFFNLSAGIAVFVPPQQQQQQQQQQQLRNASSFGLVASELETLVSIGAGGPAAHVVLDGIHWRHARFAGLILANCTGCLVSGGSVAFAGAMCVNVTGGGGSGVVNGTEVFGCGTGGVFLDGGNRTTLEPAGHAVSGALIHDWNRRVWCNAPGVMLSGVGCNVTASELHSAPHMGVYAMGDEHAIEGNHFHEIVVHSSDAGVTYAGRDWTYRGIRIVGNRFENIQSDNAPNSWFSVTAVYFDDACSGGIIEGNSFTNVARVARLYGGRSHRFVGNVAVNVSYDVVQADKIQDTCNVSGSVWLERLGLVPYNTSAAWIAAYGGFPDLLPPILDDEPCLPKYNEFVNNSACGVGGQFMVPFNGSQEEAWGGRYANNTATQAC